MEVGNFKRKPKDRRVKNKIILTAEGTLEDVELRDWVSKLAVKIDTINERTKIHTLDIKKIERKLKDLQFESP